MRTRSMLHRRAAPFAAVGLFLLGACVSAPRGAYNSVEGAEGQKDVVRTSRNRDLENSIELKDIVQVRKDGMLLVQFEMVNKLDRQLAFQWGMEWYDRAGLVIDYGPAHYRPEKLAGRQSKTVKVVAPSPEATGWKLQVGSRDEVQ